MARKACADLFLCGVGRREHPPSSTVMSVKWGWNSSGGFAGSVTFSLVLGSEPSELEVLAWLLPEIINPALRL